MPRRASWKPLRGDGRRAFLRRAGRSCALAGGYAAVTAGLATLGAPYAIVPAGALFAWPLLSRAARRGGTPSAPLTGLLPWPPPEGVFPARVRYLRYADEIEEDEAVVAFAGGWLVVDGLRARFSVRADDAHPTFTGFCGLALDLPHGERVEIEPFDVATLGGETRGALQGRFDREARAWAVGPSGPGEPVLPPSPPHWGPLGRAGGHVCVGFMGVCLGLVLLLPSRYLPALTVPGAVLLGLGLGAAVHGVVLNRRYLRYVRSLPPALRRGVPYAE